MKKLNRSYPGFQIGTSLILVIITTMCLVILAVLSLSTALRDRNYSQQLAEQTTQFYEANNKAYDLLRQIDNTNDPASIPDILITEEEPGTRIISYEVPISEEHLLEIVVKNTNEQTHILKWKKSSRAVWESHTSLPLLEVK